MSSGSVQVANYLDYSPGLRSIALRSMHAAPGGISWPLYWTKHGGFHNLKHFVLVGVDLYFDSGTEWVASLESFEIEHCCLRSVGESGGTGKEVSLLHVLKGSVTTICSLKLVSMGGISPETVKDTIGVFRLIGAPSPFGSMSTRKSTCLSAHRTYRQVAS